jgi:hypothetical protein
MKFNLPSPSTLLDPFPDFSHLQNLFSYHFSSERDAFIHLSSLWQPLQVSSITETEKRARAGDIDAGKVGEAELAAGLRAVLGPEAAWKSEKQAESMRAIM